MYRPHCKQCNGCVPTRIPVANFPLRRSHRRVINKNRDLTINIEEASFNSRFYDLYQRYINVKHADGDMFPPSIDQYKTFLLSPWADSIFISSYLGKKLISVAVTDRQAEGLSAIYTFYDPYESRRSLGTFNILNQIRIASELDLEYLYLGYWIANNEKMHYKINFKPLELLINSQWTKIGFT